MGDGFENECINVRPSDPKALYALKYTLGCNVQPDLALSTSALWTFRDGCQLFVAGSCAVHHRMCTATLHGSSHPSRDNQKHLQTLPRVFSVGGEGPKLLPVDNH